MREPHIDVSEDQLRQKLAVERMVRRIGHVCLRAKSEDGLYAEVCALAVDGGALRHAWIGMFEPDSPGLKMLAAEGGAVVFSDPAGAPAALAEKIRASGRPQIHSESARGSVLGLPLYRLGKLAGMFLLQADSAAMFTPDIAALLEEAADDIALAQSNIVVDDRRLVAETRLNYLAFYDAQTGLPNRALLEQRLAEMALLAQEKGAILVLIVVKLLRINQALQLLGNAGMDEVLQDLALRFEQFGGVDTLVSQLAQDEFALACTVDGDPDAAMRLARQVHALLNEPVKQGDKEIFLQASVGGAVYPIHETDIRYLLRRARAAAEQFGGEVVRLYSPEIDKGLEQRLAMQADLHRALERNEFVLYYQPQLNLKSGEIVGAEALLRWRHPGRGIVAPALFIPLLEEMGLMPEVGTWVLKTACREIKQWQEQGYEPLRVAVNMSTQQFRMADLVATVRAALDEARLDPSCLELELTESLILESAERTIKTMHELKKMGVGLSLDDFGTGYSSLSYLHHYPVDRIKIDQSFVRDMTEHAASAALVRSILAMAGNLGLTTIAEGVETAGQYGYLRKQLCQEMQGFLFSHPLPAEEFARLLQDGKKFDTPDVAAQASCTVLLVDDELNLLSAMRRAFRNESWKLLTASSASEGLDLLARHGVGVVVSDQRMAAMSGTEFLSRVKKMYPDTIRILLTGYADFTTVIDAVNQGDLYKVLSKPIEDRLLREHIQEALRRYEVFYENRRLTQRLLRLESPAGADAPAL